MSDTKMQQVRTTETRTTVLTVTDDGQATRRDIHEQVFAMRTEIEQVVGDHDAAIEAALTFPADLVGIPMSLMLDLVIVDRRLAEQANADKLDDVWICQPDGCGKVVGWGECECSYCLSQLGLNQGD